MAVLYFSVIWVVMIDTNTQMSNSRDHLVGLSSRPQFEVCVACDHYSEVIEAIIIISLIIIVFSPGLDDHPRLTGVMHGWKC